jgi:hypothetical protein
VERGEISVTPVYLELTDSECIQTMSGWDLDEFIGGVGE